MTDYFKKHIIFNIYMHYINLSHTNKDVFSNVWKIPVSTITTPKISTDTADINKHALFPYLVLFSKLFL